VITMKEKKKTYPNPKFGSAEEEDKYWAAHSPIDEGYTGKVQVEKQKRSSFLTIRLTGDELTQLRDLAAKKGMGPSTYIRSNIKDLLDGENPAYLHRVLNHRILQSMVSEKPSKVYNTTTKSNSLSTDIAVIREQVEVLVQELVSTETLDQLVAKVYARMISNNALNPETMKRVKVKHIAMK
jgi:hypothetical protein